METGAEAGGLARCPPWPLSPPRPPTVLQGRPDLAESSPALCHGSLERRAAPRSYREALRWGKEGSWKILPQARQEDPQRCPLLMMAQSWPKPSLSEEVGRAFKCSGLEGSELSRAFRVRGTRCAKPRCPLPEAGSTPIGQSRSL